MRGGFAKNDWQAFFLAITLASCSGGDDSISPAVVKAASGGTPPPQYAASCGACHAVGVAGAPKTGDSEAWVARFKCEGYGWPHSIRSERSERHAPWGIVQ